ncbi:flavin reductase family protein [Odoribacter sp. AF15-53]|mgnify:FL=1|uniref:flavin reductase family protein n=1 Tax=Odoribacter sp. AF15-53 TaxID=2292236 RepID=UPI000E4AA0D4|nr:flavin reductase family protein [Odoribacter sp. AF15-53]RHR79004.1 flavin reductase family protein [Odoribacter sp. AF15-53]
MEMKKIEPKEIDKNVIRLIGEDWMLVAAGNREKFNMMTASWGSMGYLWNKPVVMVFVRPQRYTFEFSEKQNGFTLSFFDEKYRKALNVCGTVSGREVDKVKESGLTPYFTEAGNPAFEEAVLVLECKKLYGDFLKEEAFADQKIVDSQYGQKDFHKMYVAEIVNAWVKE